LTEKKLNKWKISTFVILIIFVFVISTSGYGLSFITKDSVTNDALEFINTNLLTDGTQAEITGDVTEEGGLYKIPVSINGAPQFLYITKSGEYLVQPLVSLKEEAQEDTTPEPEVVEDWTVFENVVPEDIKSEILQYTYEEPSEYDDRTAEFTQITEIENTMLVFYHSGCGWCTKYYPVLVEVQEEQPELTIYALDLNDNRDIAEVYQVTGTPASIINGKYKISGYLDKEVLDEKLNLLL
jgi:thiol-disulfide isomerase/thioredoxin